MPERLRFHPRVAADILAASDWYEARSVELSDRFRVAVDRRFDDILAAPALFPRAFADADHRFVQVPKFPYLILFRERADAIEVIGLFHSASDPDKWLRRARTW
jgi:hypothetical protein